MKMKAGYSRFAWAVMSIIFMTACIDNAGQSTSATGRDYYIDSDNGDDNNSGTSEALPWKSLDQVTAKKFQPGDNIYFKRGSSYEGHVAINGDGTKQDPITISAYGTGDAPQFTNPDSTDHNGVAMAIRGDYHIVENLYFHHCAPAPGGRVSFQRVWAMGALHVSLGNDYVTIRNNEFANNPKAIQTYSEYSLITNNYIHDSNPLQSDGFLSAPYWGPIGIQIGIGNQEISYNRIENMFVGGGEWGGDGGAFEIDDGRNHKDSIYLHHNMTYHNMGFVEISYSDDFEKRSSSNIRIDHNVSRDYQAFVLWWAPTENSIIEQNTIIRTDNEYTGPFDGVFIIDGRPADIRIRKNIVVSDKDLTEAIFVKRIKWGALDVSHTENLYWDVVDGQINLGVLPGADEIVADPLFVDWHGGDYHLQPGSPAEGWGALND